jgi:hypothetical protein
MLIDIMVTNTMVDIRAAEYVSGWAVHWYVDFLGLAVSA